MKNKTIAITGASGFLGETLVAIAVQQGYCVLPLYFRNPPSSIPSIPSHPVDLRDTPRLSQFFSTYKPDYIIHTAALSQPDYCELHPEESMKTNVEATLNVARHAKALNIPFIFTSTDLVFDGENPPYNENSQKQPCNIYGMHKSQTEDLLLDLYPDGVTICRLPLLYGKTSILRFVENIKNGQQQSLFTDEYRTSNSTNEVSQGLLKILDLRGIYHFGGKESLSRYEFGIKVAQHFNLPTTLIIPTKQRDISTSAPRARDVSMNTIHSSLNLFSHQTIEETLQVL